MEIYDVIIIGAGPAGLFAGINLKNKKVLILEKKDKPGRKLLISGGGKCNITNTGKITEFITHYGEKKNFVKKAIYAFSNDDLINFFEINFYIDDSGKVFPESMRAKEILNYLLDEYLEDKKHEIIYNSKVEKVIKSDEYFKVYTESGIFNAKNLIVATGGKSFPMTGSTGDGYKIAKSFGHTIISPRPALTPIEIENYPFVDLAGISINVWIKKAKNKMYGSLLFTHKGFSGPVVLNFSRYLNDGDKIQISFVDFDNEEKFRKYFVEKSNQNKNMLLYDFLKKEFRFPRRFIAVMFRILNIDKNKRLNNLSRHERNNVIQYLVNHEFKVKKIGDFNIAMVTKGGIDTREINSKSMESKLVENLYFIGEVVDVDGYTGGYNLQWAFSSAYIAAKNIIEKGG
ncbi:hypothetical protein XO10_03450 [Marinitoga sp. 1135]|uniref:Flavoprotein, HI0933 family n=1 Tax=Marinitoga piezophila (strain DSM 14283 / JCM 11233 / KA3) TaxID=443254 RepID=H2J657_MARPK|nr:MULTISPECIES: NAD(P)/FAD-dependent oxidoreductase [Marinitoga]AEX85118.1 flavoprotein, HI0933 family [Marinitoga piezophila KA3]APT75620.1 hypothetical protein LN42_03850 [Marinitoga sp. 1137]NUU95330.1 hypothetical protein [Marinitoga sp. 1135]NUU97264.1 hypothetical protein [Marinitoga sp. 1138]